jgi:acetyl-CoA carboxylase biotin carboxylase subunit
VLAHGADREEALARMRRALDEFSVQGTQTTIPLLREILDDPRFVSGDYDTSFLERRGAGDAGRLEPQPESSGSLAVP